MILPFSPILNSRTTYFIERIWKCLEQNGREQYLQDKQDYNMRYVQAFGREWDQRENLPPKLHTIRSGQRWAAGQAIELVFNSDAVEPFQFAPPIQCISTQDIEIRYQGQADSTPLVSVDGKQISERALEQIALNDGFDHVEDLLAYFKGDFSGQIIHWTNLSYK